MSQNIDQSNRRIYSLRNKTQNICYVPRVTKAIYKVSKVWLQYLIFNEFFSFDQSDRSIWSRDAWNYGKHFECLLLLATNTHAKFDICRTCSSEEN